MTQKEKLIRQNAIDALKSLLESNGFQHKKNSAVWKKKKYRFKFNPLKLRFEKNIRGSWTRIFSIYYRDLPQKYGAIVDYLLQNDLI